MKTPRAVKTREKAKLAFSIRCPSLTVDGLPLGFQPSFALEVGRFGPTEIKKALADSEIITSLLREHPEEMAEIVNHVLAGQMDSAKKVALRIGLTEEAFQRNGGGMLFWLAIAFTGGFIIGYAATHV